MTIEFLPFDKLKRKISEVSAVLSTSFFLGYLVVKYEAKGFVLGLGFLVFVIFLIYQLQGNLTYKKSLFFIPLIVCSIPLQGVFLTTLPLLVAAQFLIFPILLAYFLKFPSNIWSDYVRRIRPLIFPTVALRVFFHSSRIRSPGNGQMPIGDLFCLC